MHYRALGQTGLQVSEVGLGAMPFGGMVTQADERQFAWSGTDARELIALVHRSEELGVNLIGTAEAYGDGHGEAISGEALQGRRHKWIIATKVRPNQGLDADTPDEPTVRKRITEACEQSLHRLGFLQTPSRSLVQAALRFVLDHPGVSSVIAGAKTRQRIEENIAASALPSYQTSVPEP
jgi:aryl-alcohol dehydrogenase-like predicted oxidoreductase